MVTILMTSAKIATIGLLKVKAFGNKGYNVVIFVHHLTNEILSH